LEVEEEPVIYVKVLLRRPWQHWKRFRISRETDMLTLKLWNEDTGHWKKLFTHCELQEVKLHLLDVCPRIPWIILRDLGFDDVSLISIRSTW